MMAEAGVNIPKFKAHSIRAVGTSAAAKVGVPIKLIQTYTLETAITENSCVQIQGSMYTFIVTCHRDCQCKSQCSSVHT